MILQKLFRRYPSSLIIWCILASFGAYFCMYAFRKPFTTGLYTGYNFGDFHYKSILIISQVLGYMLSKFIGIKVISELKAAHRIRLITGLVVFAELALLGFGLVPYPYNFIFIFLSGLPLGMVWGVVFSFIEGRRFTELLAMGLSISIIVASGILKTVYFELHEWWPLVSEFWMPSVIGLLFLPLFLLFVWMLSVIPKPDETDVFLRSERLPMTKEDKRNVWGEYKWGILCFVIIYSLLTTMRDFRDNFSVEIWSEIDPLWDKFVFARTEVLTGIIVLTAVASLSLIRNNIKGFWGTQWLIALGILSSGAATLLFQWHYIGPFYWMLLLGTGMFLAYTPIQVALFERMIAMFKIKANAGFFVYICDSIGYLGSVGLLFYKEFFMKDLSWAKVLMRFSYSMTGVCLLFLVLAAMFFNRKAGIKGPVTKKLGKFQFT